jgi:Protein of unknown function (DUF2934)
MARLRKNETGINIASTAAAPARRKAAPAARKRTITQPAAGMAEAEPQEDIAIAVTSAVTIAEPVIAEVIEPGIVEVIEPIAAEPVVATGEETVTPGQVAPTHEAISALAYFYWVERGCTEGNPHHDWLRAEAELKQRAFAAV